MGGVGVGGEGVAVKDRGLNELDRGWMGAFAGVVRDVAGDGRSDVLKCGF